MHQQRRRDRRPVRRTPARPAEPPAPPGLSGVGVVVVGLFSAKEAEFAALMEAAAAELEARGARVVGRVVQRRGVSAGGARKMSLPYSSRTLLSSGKARELAEMCERTGAGAAVFVNPLTERQRHALTTLLDRPAVSLADARMAPARPGRGLERP
ncbi:hypothetical protein [Streptomyces sp. NPDC056600]|uniref:hypothetical protein n=1 Tax=Streptomyces sp. NPDC056600 TaxID=3345874 RepID=UPI0036C598F0